MAQTIRLEEGWTLTDGYMDAFPIPRPTDVRTALTERGILPQDSDRPECEWIYRRTWVYSCPFDFPKEGDERTYLDCDFACDCASVFVNGECAGALQSGIEITRHLREGKNRLAISCDASGRGYTVGIEGKISLRTGSYMEIRAWDIKMADGVAKSRISCYAHIGGKYEIAYSFVNGEGEAETFAFTENLRACETVLTHEMRLQKPMAYRTDNAEDTAYIARLDIARAGIGCAHLDRAVANLPEGCVASFVCGAARVDKAARALFKEMGADGAAGLPEHIAAREGFLPTGDAGDRILLCERSLADGDTLTAKDGLRLNGGFLWKYSESEPYDEEEMEHLFGVNASGDLRRAAKLSRFLQAEKLLRKCLLARRDGKKMLLPNAIDERERYCSASVVQYVGRRKPAYFALKTALKKTQVWCDAPLFCGNGAPIEVAFGLLGAQEKSVYMLRADLFDMAGARLSGVELPVYSDGALFAGTFTAHMPENTGACVLRVTATDDRGNVSGKADFTICHGAEVEAELAYLLSPDIARIAQNNGKIRNEGEVVALSASHEGGYGALLPTEEAPCAGEYGCLNI